MSMHKSDKELAFLHDLYVATDWGERFAALLDERVKLPKEGSILYVASGTGSHALALGKRAGRNVSVVCVDESEERLELARAKAALVKDVNVEFRHSQLEALALEDEAFDLVIGDASLVEPERLPEMLSEMTRVAVPGATVSMGVVTASSFGEFFSIYWEALASAGYEEQAAEVGLLIETLPTVTDIEAKASSEALEDVESWTSIEEFGFPTGAEFLAAPLINDFLLDRWLELLPDDEARSAVLREVERIVDEDRAEGEFALSIKATIVVGRKAK